MNSLFTVCITNHIVPQCISSVNKSHCSWLPQTVFYSKGFGYVSYVKKLTVYKGQTFKKWLHFLTWKCSLPAHTLGQRLVSGPQPGPVVPSCQSHWLWCQTDRFYMAIQISEIVNILRYCKGVGFLPKCWNWHHSSLLSYGDTAKLTLGLSCNSSKKLMSHCIFYNSITMNDCAAQREIKKQNMSDCFHTCALHGTIKQLIPNLQRRRRD